MCLELQPYVETTSMAFRPEKGHLGFVKIYFLLWHWCFEGKRNWGGCVHITREVLRNSVNQVVCKGFNPLLASNLNRNLHTNAPHVEEPLIKEVT